MQKRVLNIEELTKEDFKKFYKQLEQASKKIRILNELPEENDNSLHF